MKNKSLSKQGNNNILNNKQENSLTSSTNENVLQKGSGILSFIFGSEASKYATKLSLDAFEMHAPLVGLFVVKHAFDNEVKLNFGQQSESGKTVLHWLVAFSGQIPFAKTLLFDSLNLPGISKYLNKQDVAGNTVAHIAMYLSEINNVNMDDIIAVLVKKGVDLTINNNEGRNIVLEEVAVPEKVEKHEHYNINQIFVKKSDSKDKEKANEKIEEISDSEAAKIAKKIADNFVIRTDTVGSETINFDRETVDKTDEKGTGRNSEMLAEDVRDIIKVKNMAKEKKEEKKEEKKPVNFGGNRAQIQSEDSMEVINELLEKFNKKSSLNKVAQSFQIQNKNQLGGNKIVGNRKRISYSEPEMSGGQTSTSSDDKNNENSDQTNKDNFDNFYKKVEEMAKKDNTDISSISMVSSSFGDDATNNKMAKNSESDSETQSSTSNNESDEKSNSTSEQDTTVSSDNGFLDKKNDDEIMEQFGLQKLGRFINPESTKRHDEAVKRIKDILKVDEVMAKVYKAFLYKKIKEENTNLNNDEVAKELEKQSSDEKLLKAFIKTLDSKKVNELKEIIEKKGENKSSEKKGSDKKSSEKKLSRFIQDLSEELDFKSDSDAYTSD
jgi:hypothetical protein